MFIPKWNDFFFLTIEMKWFVVVKKKKVEGNWA